MIDFDHWRHNYSKMTYAEHVEFYRKVAEVYPDQQHYNEPAIREFLDGSSGPVLELGGWKGELAASVLPDYPDIPEWLNVEIAPQAVTESACDDPRYAVIVPDAFLWDAGLDLSRFTTFVASHVIEHLTYRDAVKLMGRISAKWVYIDAPLPRLPSLWDGGEASHIIEVGWNGLDNLMASHGYRKVGSSEGGPWDSAAHWFKR